MAESEIDPANLEEFENKCDELMEGLLEAYEAGYQRALEDIEESRDEPPAAEDIAGSDYIAQCHFYYWDGRVLPLEFWLREQLGIDKRESTKSE